MIFSKTRRHNEKLSTYFITPSVDTKQIFHNLSFQSGEVRTETSLPSHWIQASSQDQNTIKTKTSRRSPIDARCRRVMQDRMHACMQNMVLVPGYVRYQVQVRTGTFLVLSLLTSSKYRYVLHTTGAPVPVQRYQVLTTVVLVPGTSYSTKS
jgi:hypothetical protein